MGKAAYKRVVERHHVDEQAAHLAKLFETAIEEQRSRPLAFALGSRNNG
jgi:hypothetical protein